MPSLDSAIQNCEFCAIARGDDHSVEVICQDASWIAFFPLKPATPGHTLIIPRAHVSDLWEAEVSAAEELMRAVVQVGRAIDLALNPEGMNLISSAGKTAEQTVFHLHLHVLPRWQRDGFGQIWPTNGYFEDVELDNVADRIREAGREEWKDQWHF